MSSVSVSSSRQCNNASIKNGFESRSISLSIKAAESNQVLTELFMQLTDKQLKQKTFILDRHIGDIMYIYNKIPPLFYRDRDCTFVLGLI